MWIAAKDHLKAEKSDHTDEVNSVGFLKTRPGKSAFMVVVGSVCWLALILRFQIYMTDALARGNDGLVAAVQFLGYFTILTNGLVALCLTLPLISPGALLGRYLSRPVVTSGLVVSALFTGMAYEILLRHLWSPQGLHYVVDIVLHDLLPMLFLVYWVMHVPKQGLRWTHALLWLTYPSVYFLYTLLYGALDGFYPYPFLNASALGYPRVLTNAAFLLAAFLALGLLLITAASVLAARSAGVGENRERY